MLAKVYSGVVTCVHWFMNLCWIVSWQRTCIQLKNSVFEFCNFLPNIQEMSVVKVMGHTNKILTVVADGLVTKSCCVPGKNTGAGGHFLIQGIVLTQGWNPGFLNCRQILYWLSQKEHTCKSGVMSLFCIRCSDSPCGRALLTSSVQQEWTSSFYHLNILC